MKNIRTVIASLFVLIALFFIFRSAEASPFMDDLPAYQGYQPLAPVEPSWEEPVAFQASAADPDLAVTITDLPDPVLVTKVLTYTVAVTNNAPTMTATLVVMTDTLPASVSLLSANALQGGNCNPGPGTKVVCNWASLAAGSTAQAVIVVTPGSTGLITNAAEVKAAEIDLTPGNNTDSENTTVDPLADLSIEKVDNPANGVVAGENLVYTLTVTNYGPSDAAGVTISDTLPAVLTVLNTVPNPPDCKVQAGVLSCTLGTITAGATSQVVVTARVAASTPTGTQISNAATVNSSTPDPLSGNNRATQTTSVTTSANLSIAKADNPDNGVVAGTDLIYTLTVSNPLGPSDAVGVTISDTLPAALTQIRISPGPNCTVTGQRVNCDLGTLAAGGANQVVVVTARVDPATPLGTQLSNAVVVNLATPDPASGNNRATQTTSVATSADLSIVKVDQPDPVIAGTDLVYTLTVHNAGPSAAVSLLISDTLPAVLTNISITSGSWSCGAPGQLVNCTLGNLALGDSSQVVVKARVAANTTPGTQLSNAARISAATADPAPSNNRIVAGTLVNASADLRITKLDKPDNGVVAGTNLVYTLTVTNAGPSTAVAVNISDTLPAALTFISVLPGTPTCTQVNQLLTCNFGNMSVAASNQVVVTAKVNAAALPGSLTNSAVVSSSTSDPATANNRAPQSTTVTTLADPSITMVDVPDNGVIAGTNLVYNLTVSNPGPSNAANVVVSDTLPASVTYQGTTPGPFSCNYDPGTRIVTCNLTTLAPNQVAQAAITVKVNSSTPVGTINNAATVSTTTTDANAANNRAVQSTSVITQANLSIDKLDGPDPVVAGTNLVYTLTVTDGGSSDAQNVVVTDTLPAGLTYRSYGGGGWTCTMPVAQKVRCTRPSLVASTSSSVQITSTVGSGVILPLFNSAVVVSDTPDSNPGNNSANATTDVTTQADVGVSVIHKPEPVIAGTNIVYTITVANSGPSDAQNVIMTENLPAGTSFISMNAGGASCNQVVRTITCSFSPILANSNRQVVVTALVASGTTGIINNTAALNGAGGTPPNNRTVDPNPANDSHADPANIITRSDFSLLMVDKPDPVVAGTNLVYTLTVTNNGDSNSADAVVTDTLPAGVTYQSYAGISWTCELLVDGRVRCSRSGMVADTSSSVAIKVLVNSGTTLLLSNSAVVGSTTVDPNSANNTASQTTDVTTQANLGVTKLDKPDPVIAGTDLTYTVTVANPGPSDAVGVVFTDTLPSNVVYRSYTGAGWACTLNGANLRCVRSANLVAGTNDRVVITSHVKSAATGMLSNSVLVHSSTLDTLPGNNMVLETTGVQAAADLKISKVDTIDPVAPGTGMAYTIVITNAGPSDAVGVKITDTLPLGVSYVTHVPTPEWLCQVVVGQLVCSRAAPVVVSDTLQVDVAVLVDPGATGILNNLARVAATTPDPLPINNTDTEVTTLRPESDLSITKVESIDPVIAGTNLTYTLTVSNAGPSHAASLVVTDTLPANVTYQSFSGSGWECQLSGNNLVCTLPSLNRNASSTFSIHTKVLSGATGTLSNTAVVRSAWTDPFLTDNTATIGTAVDTRADLSVTKTDSPDPVAEGQPLTYKVVVKNNGPSDALSVSLTESIPAEVTFGSAVPLPQGTCSGTGPVLCDLGNLASGNSITVTVTTTTKLVANQVKNITNTAAASSTTLDPIPANDSKTISTQVKPIADLQINISSHAGTVQTGQTMTYTLWITNTGPSIAYNVVVTDTLPAEMTFKSSSRTPTASAPKVVWNLGNLNVGQSISFTLVVNVKSPTKDLLNQVVTRSNLWDIFLANNQDQVIVHAVDSVAPTATWELPAKLGERYDVGNQIVTLEVYATDNVAVYFVRFYRWDPLILPDGDFVDIGYDYTAETCQFNSNLMCFHWYLDPTILNPEWNEIRARAVDGSNNQSPSPSLYSYIFLYRNVSTVYLPFLRK